MDIEEIKIRVMSNKYRLSDHADIERENDGVEIQEIKEAILNGEIIEDYPNDPRGASCLILGYGYTKRPIHVVCGIDKNDMAVMITVYIPSLPKWITPRERSRKI